MDKDMKQQETEQRKRAEELAEAIVQLPQKFQDRIAGAVMMAQLATAEKAG